MYLPKIKFSIVVLLISSGIFAQKTNENVAYEDGNVRFTVITDGVIRMEYQPGERTVEMKNRMQFQHPIFLNSF